MVDEIGDAFEDAADQVQNAAQGAADSASNFVDSLQSERSLPCPYIDHFVVQLGMPLGFSPPAAAGVYVHSF